LMELDIRLIKMLQEGIPVTERPFEEIARRVTLSEEDVIRRINEWKANGTIRRFGAMIRHRLAGYSANAMVVWNVPEEQIEGFGTKAIEFPAVSHCYQRPQFPGFPYNIYTMIHGKSREECEFVARSISEATGVVEYKILYTNAEYKKTSPVYFG